MSFAKLEREILLEARVVTGRTTLRKKDILAWCTGEVQKAPDETQFFLPVLCITISVKRSLFEKKKKEIV